jgi:hypothetical protein
MMHPTRKTARVAGLLYLLVVLTGMFVLIFVPGRLFVRGDSAATANNILAHQSLFRTYIVVGLVSEFLFIALALVLYRLLKGVNQQHAALMVILVLIGAPQAFLGTANHVATLAFVRGAEFLTVFDKAQRDAIAMLLFNSDNQGAAIAQIFWGLWLLPLGLLVFRSGFLPRILGGWLIINGVAYVTISFTGLLLPQHVEVVSRIAIPALVGEVAFTLWLLIVGARVTPSAAGAPSSS